MKTTILTLGLMATTWLNAQAQTFDVDMTKPQPVYGADRDCGYDILPAPGKKSHDPYYFSFRVPDGNYRVTVTLGDKRRAGKTVVRAESRRLLLEETATRKGQTEDYSFVVSKRSPRYLLDGKEGVVQIKEREKETLTWDEKLTLEFNGTAPAVSRIRIEPDTTAVTLFLCGNSTVVDQSAEPWASWGQMIPRWFTDSVAVSNHAESGLTARVFIGSHRLDKVLSMMKAGDYVICEFGHNDEKEHRAGDGAWYHYIYNLKIFIDQVRGRGGNIIFCTPTQRRFWEEDNRHIKNTHGDFPQAMQSVAEREGVPVIDLNGMTKTFFETLGYEDSKRALVHYPAHTYPNQDIELADNTHFNPYGAYEVAKMVVQGMRRLALPFVQYLRPDCQPYDPSQPDDWRAFSWHDARTTDLKKPDGN